MVLQFKTRSSFTRDYSGPSQPKISRLYKHTKKHPLSQAAHISDWMWHMDKHKEERSQGGDITFKTKQSLRRSAILAPYTEKFQHLSGLLSFLNISLISDSTRSQITVKTLRLPKIQDFFMLIPGCACPLSPSAKITRCPREAGRNHTSPSANRPALRSCFSNDNYCAGEGISHMTGS